MFSTAEDDDFFNPTSSSNLATLFGTSTALDPGNNSTLVYTKPKQPKIGGQENQKHIPKQPTTQSSVICSKFVNAFKLTDKVHESQGKCGLAVIGDHSLKTYDILIYKSKQDIIMRTKLKADFTFIIQSNNFAYFCDEQKQQWSVHFENSADIEKFTEEIKLYGGTIVRADKDTDVNVSETAKPELINSHLKMSKDSDSPSDSPSSQAKANILSRMAKMGQHILPTNLSKMSSDHSDSESDKPEQNRKPPIKKRQKDYVLSDKTKISPAVNLPISNNIPQYVMVNGQIMPINSMQQNLSGLYSNNIQSQLIQNIPSQSLADPLNIFIAENRTHNCELRMNMAQISSKLDTVLTKLNLGRQTSSDEVPSEIVSELQLKLSEKIRECEESQELIKHLQKQQQELQKDSTKNTILVDELKQQTEMQATVINEQSKKIRELEEENASLEKRITNAQLVEDSLGERELKIKILEKTIDDQKMHLEQLQQKDEKKEDFQATVDELNNSIINLEEKLSNINNKADLFGKKLKHSMNLLYQEIMENFIDENCQFQSSHIRNILSQKLKNSTFMIIQEFLEDFKNLQKDTESNS